MHCLDTSFIIDYWNGEQHAAEFFNALEHNEPVWVPTVALFELYLGGELSDAPDASVETVATDLDFADPLPFGDGPARHAARIDADLTQRGEQINLGDVLIAATARTADMRLIAVDDHFDRVSDLDVHNPTADGPVFKEGDG